MCGRQGGPLRAMEDHKKMDVAGKWRLQGLRGTTQDEEEGGE